MKIVRTITIWLVCILAILWIGGTVYNYGETQGWFIKTNLAAKNSGPSKITWESIPTGEGTDRSPVQWWAPNTLGNPSPGKFTLKLVKGEAPAVSFDSAEEFNTKFAQYGHQIRPHVNPILRVIKGIYGYFTE